MRVTLQRASGGRARTPEVDRWLADERSRGLFEPGTYDAFRSRVEANTRALVAMIDELRARGARVAAYGAPAKGNTLLTYAGLGPERIEFVADRNERKHGRLTPRTHVPVVPVARVLESQPDYLLVLAWNFLDEIIEQQAEFARRGGRFIVPVPTPRILDAVHEATGGAART